MYSSTAVPIAGGPEKPPSAVVRSFDAARSISVQRQASGSPGKSDLFESQHWHGSCLLMIMTRTENTSLGPYLDTFTSVLTSSVLSWVSTRLAGWLADLFQAWCRPWRSSVSLRAPAQASL